MNGHTAFARLEPAIALSVQVVAAQPVQARLGDGRSAVAGRQQRGCTFPEPEILRHPFSERINTLRVAKEAGLSLCSGGIFGMGETWDDRLDMMFTLREIGVTVDLVMKQALKPSIGAQVLKEVIPV